jgi:hypothetical protein
LAVVINVAVSLPPAVMITSPKGGLIAGQGWQITLTATTTDGTPGTVTSVEFFDNGTKIAGGNGALSGGVWTYGWDTSAASFAAHSLVAKVTDSGGQTATSAPVLITVRLPADGNGDNIVDGEDYGIWQNGYNHPGATMNTGDYNGDGIVDGEDYGVWQNNYNRTNGLDDVAVAASPADAASLPMGGGAAPRLMAMTPASGAVVSGVTCMALVFDSDVKIGAGAVELSGLATGARSDFVAAYDAAARTLTLTWGRPLPPDVYTVRVVADFVVGAGGGAPLDGEVGNPAAATLPSGDGTPGGDARWTFTAE